MTLPILAVSAEEVVWALARAGFAIVDRPSGVIVLERGRRVVTVPMLPLLAPEAVLVLLRAAGMSYSELVELLAEAPTVPTRRVATRQERRRSSRPATALRSTEPDAE